MVDEGDARLGAVEQLALVSEDGSDDVGALRGEASVGTYASMSSYESRVTTSYSASTAAAPSNAGAGCK